MINYQDKKYFQKNPYYKGVLHLNNNINNNNNFIITPKKMVFTKVKVDGNKIDKLKIPSSKEPCFNVS